MAFTSAQDFIDVWTELDAAYVTFPGIVGAGGDYTGTTSLDTTGAFGDTIAQFPQWSHVFDNSSIDSGALAYAVNRAFVELAEEYIAWLGAGNAPILNFEAKDRGGPPAPGQSLHDNILGNLGDGPINDRFVTATGNPDITGDAVGDVVAEPRSLDGQSWGDRPYFSGVNTNNLAESIAFDLAQGIPLDQLDVSRGGLNPLDGEVLLVSSGGVTSYATIQDAENAASAGDTIVVGAGTFNESVVIDVANLTIIGANSGTAGDGSRAAETIIDGIRFAPGSDGSTLDGVFIDEGTTGLGEKWGIYVQADNITITNSVIDRDGSFETYRGILTATGDAQGLSVADNYIGGFATGLFINPGSDATVTGNVFEDNNVGLSNDGPDAAAITGNEFINSGVEHIGIGAINEPTDAGAIVGANTFSGDAPEVSIYPFGGDGQVVTGTENDDVFRGDEAFVSQEAQTFIGGQGDDELRGGAGADTLNGGEGDDTFFADATDTIVEAVGEGTDTVVTGEDHTLAANVENLTLTDLAENTEDFEDFGLGPITDGENGWAIAGNKDQEIIDESGDRAFRMSSDPNSGDFGGPYAPRLDVAAGESGTTAGADSMLATFKVKAVQPGDDSRLEVDLGNDARSDRVNFLVIENTAGGIRIATSEPLPNGLWDTGGDFNDFAAFTGNRTIIDGLDNSIEHEISLKLNFVDGSDNDVIEIFVNGEKVGETTTFENYREFHLGEDHAAAQEANQASTLFFRASAGGGAPQDGSGGQNQGFIFDDITYSTFDKDGPDGTGNELNNIINGNSGDNILSGLGGIDQLFGNAGDDTLIGGAATDLLDGGIGIDTADYSASSAPVTVRLWNNGAQSGGDAAGDILTNIENLIGSDVVSGNPKDDDLRGKIGVASKIEGLAGNDLLQGYNLADVLDGGDGNDDLRGGGDDDLLIGGAGADLINGGDGIDTADYSGSSAAVTVRLWNPIGQSGGDAAGDILTNIENLIGSDVVSGNPKDDDLRGKNGVASKIEGLAGNDLLQGYNLADVLDGGEGNDDLRGGGADDLLIGGAGADLMNGGLGIDTADYSGSSAPVTVRLWNNGAQSGGDAAGDILTDIENLIGSDAVSGNPKDDDLRGKNGVASKIEGLAGNDLLQSYDQADVLDGGDGNDDLRAGGDADKLIGGAGNDLLSGGGTDAAEDTFVFTDAHGEGGDWTDQILDFEDGVDKIDLSGVSALNSFADVSNAVTPVGQGNADLSIELGNGDVLIVRNYDTFTNLSTDDFIF
ncbi:MAG: NosD domain-containing protein [Pseudomonadota bacterium]